MNEAFAARRGRASDIMVLERTARRNWIFAFGGLVLAFTCDAVDSLVAPYADTAAGYAAKVACSEEFARGAVGQLAGSRCAERLAILGAVEYESDMSQGTTTAWLLPWRKRKAVWCGERGAVLLPRDVAVRDAIAGLGARSGMLPLRPPRPSSWPAGDEVDLAASPAYAAALDFAFSDPSWRTLAVVVARDGRIVAERYGEGCVAQTPLPSWSVAKSLTCAMVGVLVADGALRLDSPVGFPEWANDARAAITLEHLLRMESGLRWDERYDAPESDVLRMLYHEADMASFAVKRPLESPPGTRFAYASGSSLLVQRAIRAAVGDDAAYLALARKRIFEPLAMTHAFVEFDYAGTVIGSSYAHFTARDFARFGQWFLDDGVAGGARLLPAGFVGWATTPSRSARRGEYGAHWWLNRGGADGERPYPRLPRDIYFAHGHEGQFVVVVPSARLVVVRLGITQGDGEFPFEEFVARVLAAP
jgi:CubicO group peptidase (beta-lactamase class C family)